MIEDVNARFHDAVERVGTNLKIGIGCGITNEKENPLLSLFGGWLGFLFLEEAEKDIIFQFSALVKALHINLILASVLLVP